MATTERRFTYTLHTVFLGPFWQCIITQSPAFVAIPIGTYVCRTAAVSMAVTGQ